MPTYLEADPFSDPFWAVVDHAFERLLPAEADILLAGRAYNVAGIILLALLLKAVG